MNIYHSTYLDNFQVKTEVFLSIDFMVVSNFMKSSDVQCLEVGQNSACLAKKRMAKNAEM